MGRAKDISEELCQGITDHYRELDDEKRSLKSLRVVVRFEEDGKTISDTHISPEFVRRRRKKAA